MREIDPNDIESLKQKLNQDTARIRWSSLAEHQKQEAVIEVDSSLDLILVGCEFVRDNREQVAQWLQSELVTKVSDKKAKKWARDDLEMWAVVVAPWVLVQLKKL